MIFKTQLDDLGFVFWPRNAPNYRRARLAHAATGVGGQSIVKVGRCRATSSGLPLEILEHAAQPLEAKNGADVACPRLAANQLVADALTIPLDILADEMGAVCQCAG